MLELEPIRPRRCTTPRWTRALSNGHVYPLTYRGAVAIAVARVLTEAAGSAAAGALPRGYFSQQRGRDAAVGARIGLSEKVLRNLRLGNFAPKSAQVDLLLNDPGLRDRASDLLIRGVSQLLLPSLPFFRSEITGLDRRSDDVLVDDSLMSYPRAAARLKPSERAGLEEQVVRGIAALAHGQRVLNLPSTGGWAHPATVDWKEIAQIIGPGLVQPRVVYRELVRDVVSADGEPITNDEIYRAISDRLGVFAPDRRTINLAIDGLRRRGELRLVKYGTQEATHRFCQPSRSTSPWSQARNLREAEWEELMR